MYSYPPPPRSYFFSQKERDTKKKKILKKSCTIICTIQFFAFFLIEQDILTLLKNRILEPQAVVEF